MICMTLVEKEKKDGQFLSQLEKYATANKWEPSLWAAYLNALLKGRALNVYQWLSDEDFASYNNLKDALLKNLI